MNQCTLHSHRFTATFLEQVLCGAWTANGPSSPHRLLDAYVRVFTHFSPLDGKKEFLNHEPRVNEPQVATFIWDKIEKGPSFTKLILWLCI